MLGSTISQYQIIEKLGSGGMGDVYKARDTRLNRFVAIKVLAPSQAGNDDRRRRFVQEAQSASALNHPNIITIYDIVNDGPVECIVMEYIPGKTLAEMITEGGLPPATVVRLGVQIAAALSAAHGLGIIHRDLKPGNVMVTERGLVKVLDFGLAKLTDPTQAGQADETRTVMGGPLTVEGSILGTVSYMSPEQAQGKKVDARSDIFAFGAVVYEMATGHRAFEGENTLSTLTAVLRDSTPPLAQTVPGVPPEFDRIVHRCLEKNPENRYQSMAEVEEALAVLKQRYDSGSLSPAVAAAASVAAAPQAPHPAPAAPLRSAAPAKKRSSAALIGGLAVVLALLGGVAWFFMRPKGPPDSVPSTSSTAQSVDASKQAAAASPTIAPETGPAAAQINKPAPSKALAQKEAEVRSLPVPMPDQKAEPKAPEPPTPPAAASPQATAPHPVTVPDGMPFSVSLSEDIPADAEEGMPLQFVSSSDVKVGTAVVIAKGSPVTGAILESKRKKVLGMGGRMTLRMMTVRTVDGKTINVRATSGRRSDGVARRPVETANSSRSKELAAAKGAGYVAFVDGDAIVNVQP